MNKIKLNEKGTTRNEFPDRGNNRLLLVEGCSECGRVAEVSEESGSIRGTYAVLLDLRVRRRRRLPQRRLEAGNWATCRGPRAIAGTELTLVN